jgi:alpha-tubulin suppressor-like RCC1 family protein
VVNGLTVSAKGCGLTGGQHTLAIDSTGAVHSWGYNFYGMLGNNSTTASRIPVNISTFGSLVGRTVVAVAGGNYHTVALDSTGAVHTWGYNQYGQLGNNNTTNSLIPVNISTFGSLLGRTVVAVATGGNHMVALDSTGAVHTWGYNQDGQLGNNTTTQSNIPINVSTFGSLSGRTMVMIAANRSQTFALDNTGAVHSWGYNFYGILGNNASGPGTNSLVPINVSTFGSLSGRTVVAVAAGYEHTHALDSTGAVHSWGYNGYGTLGNGNTTQSAIPVNVSTFGSLSGRTVVAVAAGTEQTLALDNTGAVHTWGRNLYGSLGNNSTTQSAIPVNVSTFGSLSGRTVVAVAAGYEHTLALDSTGAVHTWGYNAYGMLGNNSTTNSLIPINNIGTTINAALGIGLAPAYQLQLSLDSAAKPSSSTWTVSSDERLKTDIEVADYDRCYEIVSSLDLKSYNWNSNIPKLMQSVGSDHHRLGWIAQELEPVFPKAINIVPDLYGLSNVLNVNFDQLYAVQYGALKKLMNKVAILEQHMINKSIN